MKVLSLVHGPRVRSELFGDVVRERGHELDEVSITDGTAPDPGRYDAVLVFGGRMNVDEEDGHPWLVPENALLQELLARGIPTFGVCLGVQLLAKAAGAWVGPATEPERGWFEVRLTDAGAADPVLGVLPRRFCSLQMHEYTYALPAEAVDLAGSDTNPQAFRLGESAWGVQFHPEVTASQLRGWPDAGGFAAETRERIGEWNTLGRRLCDAFLDAATRSARRS